MSLFVVKQNIYIAKSNEVWIGVWHDLRNEVSCVSKCYVEAREHIHAVDTPPASRQYSP